MLHAHRTEQARQVRRNVPKRGTTLPFCPRPRAARFGAASGLEGHGRAQRSKHDRPYHAAPCGSSLHTGHLGSTDTISDSNGGSFTQHFDPFGAPLSPQNPELTRVGFTGQDQDVDLGFTDMKGRMYDPLAGRFASPDPEMQAPFWSQGLNRYSYVFNDPINNTDPSGFDVNGKDSTIGIMGWGGGVVGGAALSGFGASASAIGGGALATGANLLTTGLSGLPGVAGSTGGTYSGVAPTAAPASRGASRGSPQATGEIGPVGPSVSDVQARGDRLRRALDRVPDARLAQNAPAPTSSSDGVVGVVKSICGSNGCGWLETIVSLAGGEVTGVVNIIISLEQHRAAYVAQMATRAAAREIVIIPGKSATVGPPLSEDEAIEHVKQGGDVVARDRSTAKRIAEGAGSGAPAYDPPHKPGQKPHFHPTGPNGERVGGHVLF